MRRLLISLVFVLLSLLGTSQVIPTVPVYGLNWPRGGFDSVCYLPTGCGVPSGTASLRSYGFAGTGQKLKKIAIYGDTCGHHVYWYDPSNSTWAQLDGGGGSGTDSAVASGLWTKKGVTGTTITIYGDSAAMAGYFLRRGDSAVSYITPTQFVALLGLKISTSLLPGNILIGNASGVAQAFSVSGDFTINNTGIGALKSIIAAGSCTNCNIAYDANGRIISASTPAGGGFVTAAQLAKNMPSNDTTWRRIAMIPNIDVTPGTCNGCNMHWFPLITGGNHGQTPNCDSDIYVSPSGHPLIYFETMFAVANSNWQPDEVTFPAVPSVIGNADNIEIQLNLLRTGVGFMVHGNNTNAWVVANSQLYTYAISGNTGASPDSVPAAAPTDLKFDLLDGTNMFLGPTISGLMAQYHGGNGYSLERFATSPHQFNFRLKDAFGGIVIGYPQTSDSIWVFDGAAHWEQLDARQFLTGTNWLFATGLANAWFGADVRMFPDSQRIGHPFLTAVASGTPGQINLTWPRVTNDLNGYLLERSTTFNFSGGVTTLVNPISLGGTLVTSFNDTGLTTGTTYYYRLRASRINGQYSDHSRRQITVAP